MRGLFPPFRCLLSGTLAVVCLAILLRAAQGQVAADPLPVPTRPPYPAQYDRLDAAWDSHQYAETRRRTAIDRQLEMNEAMVRRAEAAARAGAVWGYGPAYPPGWDYYLYGVYDRRASRAYRRHLRRSWRTPPPGFNGHVWVGVHPWFELQYGPYVDRVPQPRGHVKIYTGPNGYIYRPLYGPPAPAPPTPEPTPALPDPAQAAPQSPAPEGEIIPAPMPEGQQGPQLLPPPTVPDSP